MSHVTNHTGCLILPFILLDIMNAAAAVLCFDLPLLWWSPFSSFLMAGLEF
jgi:hypothetical protein